MLRFCQRSVLILLVMAGITDLQAQEVTINSHQEAYNLALEQNLDLKNLLLNEQHAELEYKRNKNLKKPTINGTFSGQRNLDLATTPLPAEIFGGTPGTTIDTQFGQEYNFNAGITITKQLFDRKAKLNSRIAKLNTERSRLDKAVYEELLYEKIFLYYYTALIATKAIELGESDLRSASQITALTKEKNEQGLLDASSAINTSINENKVKQGLNANKQLLVQCTTELKKLIGLESTQILTLNEKVGYELPKPILNQRLRSYKSLESSQMEVDHADLQVDMSQAALLPTVTLNTYHGSQQFRNNFGLGLSSDDWSPYSYVTLNVSVPIFSGFRNKQKIKQSKISLEVVQNDEKQMQQESLLNDELLLSNYNLSLRDANLSKDTFDLYKKSLSLSSQRYEEGLISLDAHLLVFVDYIKAENAYLNSLSSLYSYYSQIEHRL